MEPLAVIAIAGLLYAASKKDNSPVSSEVLPDEINNENSDFVRQFLLAIAASENTPAQVIDGTAFQKFYGGSMFYDFSDHPVLTGEKQGIPLPDNWCARAGLSPGCVSTAAGALQINLPTWREFRNVGYSLPDFSPDSQLELGRRLLEKTGALDALLSGDIEQAVFLASPRWASLPFSQSGQRKLSMAAFLNNFEQFA